jgi:hypothetical protein
LYFIQVKTNDRQITYQVAPMAPINYIQYLKNYFQMPAKNFKLKVLDNHAYFLKLN